VSAPSFVVNEKDASVEATVPVGPDVIATAGEVTSLTTTANEPLVVFPAASVAEHATDVVPSGKVEPDGGVQVGNRDVGPSAAVAVNVTVVPAAALTVRVIVAGSVSVGGVVSETVTVKDAEPVLPTASVAVQTTVVTPSGKLEPELGVQVGLPSLAVTENVTAIEGTPLTLRVMLPGVVTTGAVTSCTVTVNEPEELLPSPSVALHETVVLPYGNADPDGGLQERVTGPCGSVAPAVYETGTGGVVALTLST
jgi:hypothetical protein